MFRDAHPTRRTSSCRSAHQSQSDSVADRRKAERREMTERTGESDMQYANNSQPEQVNEGAADPAPSPVQYRALLTGRQQAILDFIRSYITTRGYPPTLREIGAQFGIRSTNGVNDHLRALERKGYIRRHDMQARSTVLVDAGDGAPIVQAAADWRTENTMMRGLLTRVLGASQLIGELRPEMVTLLGDIRRYLRGT